MGADAEVYVFDHRRFQDEVVPALRELLRAADTWAVGLAEAVVEDPDLPSYARRHPVDLARHCSYLGEDLRLPRYEPTFEAMTSFKRRSGYPAEPFHELSLSFVRTVATIAARDGQGILWGNDLMASHWRELAR